VEESCKSNVSLEEIRTSADGALDNSHQVFTL